MRRCCGHYDPFQHTEAVFLALWKAYHRAKVCSSGLSVHLVHSARCWMQVQPSTMPRRRVVEQRGAYRRKQELRDAACMQGSSSNMLRAGLSSVAGPGFSTRFRYAVLPDTEAFCHLPLLIRSSRHMHLVLRQDSRLESSDIAMQLPRQGALAHYLAQRQAWLC